MGLPKGRTNNIKGRQKGKPNKITNDLRESIKSFLDRNMEDLQSEYERLEPLSKLIFIEKLLPYVVPKMQAVQIDGSIEVERLNDEQVNQLFNKIMNGK